MYRSCHRCHAELPGDVAGGTSYGGDEERALFCPRCGAPQILLPEYLRAEVAATPAGDAATTGTVPPPRPQLVEWTVAIRCVLPVAIATGVLSVLAFVAPGASLLNMLCVLGGSGIVLGLYRARVGLLTGLMMVLAMGIGLSAAGAVARVALHRTATLDAEMNQYLEAQRAQVAASARAQAQDAEAQQHVVNLLTSPEGEAACVLGTLAFCGGFIVLLTSALGGFAGLLQTRRRALRRGD
jgi:hypothetical protein